jgi:hypothetical protein
VKAGQVIGHIGAGHLHYEEIHPTTPDGRPNRVYQEFERNGNASTSYQRGTTNPQAPDALNIPRGTRLTGGQPLPGSKPPVAPVEVNAEARNRQILFGRARARNVGLTIRVRGPRGVKVSSDSSGSVSPAVIERSMDATGGGQIESPA